MKQQNIQEQLEMLAEKIRQADAIVIGGGSGLSSAGGYNHYHWTPKMKAVLQPFVDHYGFESPFAGFYYCYSSQEAQWGYYSQYVRCMQESPTITAYEDLKVIIADKPVFVLTTNIDGQFSRVISEEKICCYQGDFRYIQCSQPCHDQVYENTSLVKEMTRQLHGVRIPSDLVPRCPECGRMMVPWVRDDTFLEGRKWREGVSRYQRFLREYLIEKAGSKVVFLELGVGEMTPGIIKLPFWEMTEKNAGAFYACMNQKDSLGPAHLNGKSMYIATELKGALQYMKQVIKRSQKTR